MQDYQIAMDACSIASDQPSAHDTTQEPQTLLWAPRAAAARKRPLVVRADEQGDAGLADGLDACSIAGSPHDTPQDPRTLLWAPRAAASVARNRPPVVRADLQEGGLAAQMD